MPWFPTKGLIRRHMIRQRQPAIQLAYNQQLAEIHLCPLLLQILLLLLVWESVLVRDRVMLLLIRFVGENEGNDVDLQRLHNGGSPIILRGEPPPIIILQPLHSSSLSLLSSLPSRPLTSSFPQWSFSVCCHYTSPHIDGLCWLQSHTRCICSVSLDVMCSNSGPLTLKLSIDFEISDLSGDKGYR